MSTKEILAGKAYGELSLRDKMTAGLKTAQANLMSFAARANSFGTRVLAGFGLAGGAFAFGKITGLFDTFTNVGAELQDMSNQTGFAAESLSALSYAAQMTGTNVEAVGPAARSLSKFTLDVAKGGKQSAATLKLLGINAKEFLAATPEAKLMLVADSLAKIHDPLIRNALAMKVLGKGAKDLMPMLAEGSKGLMKLFAEGRDNGAILSQDEITKAAELDDAWDRLKATGQGLINVVAIPLADALATVLNWATKGVAAVSAFLKANQVLVVVGAIVVGTVFAIGGALIGLAGAAWVVATAIGAITTIMANWAAIMAVGGAVLAFILNPITLLVAGIVGLIAILVVGAAMWFRYTKSGQEAFAMLATYIAEWKDTVLLTIAGVTDAIASNNWEQATRVASAGLASGFSLTGLTSIWDAFTNYLWQSWYSFIQMFADTNGWLEAAMLPFQEFMGTAYEGANPYSEMWSKISADAANELEKLQNEAATPGTSKGQSKAASDYANAKADLEKEREKARLEREQLDKAAADKAKEEREKIEKAWKDKWGKIMGSFGGLNGAADPAKLQGSHFSTFSGTAANLAAQMRPESAAHERTAKATEASLEKLSEIKKAIEDNETETYGD